MKELDLWLKTLPASRQYNVFWFRRDLRLEDNMGLAAALTRAQPVLLLFIFDTDILDRLEDEDDRRISFIYDSLFKIYLQAKENGSTLLVLRGRPVEVFGKLVEDDKLIDIYANEDYEPYARQRDMEVQSLLRHHGRYLHLHKDQVIFRPGEVLKNDGSPYTIYTPYSRKWRNMINEAQLKGSGSERYLKHLMPCNGSSFPELHEIGFRYQSYDIPTPSVDTQVLTHYHQTRDYPGQKGTSRLGTHIRFGTISVRALVNLAITHNDTWLGELIWREFFAQILYYYPAVTSRSFKPAYDRIQWINDPGMFERWKQGTTGFPLVDAGMRELRHTGFMHNRVRMLTASFLSKHLLVDWRLGEAWFARYLLDFDLASNNGNWQWAAGTGCDAAPYFRIFNPTQQQKKFDPNLEYIRKWIPEIGRVDYIKPIVDHTMARQRCLLAYKKALSKE